MSKTRKRTSPRKPAEPAPMTRAMRQALKALAQRGGRARWAGLTKEEKAAHARKAGAARKWDARRAIAGTEDEPKSTDFTAASGERSGDASAITKKRAGHIAAEPGVNRADDRAIANVRAAAQRRPPPFPGSTPGRPLSLDAQARERPCHCHAEGAATPAASRSPMTRCT